MKVIDSQVYAFSKDNEPCCTAQPGEVLVFKTLDCFSNRISDEGTTMADLDYTYGFANPAAGPVYIEGAEPGDVLVVDVYEVDVADEGTIATDDHCGPLFETTGYRTKKIPIRDGMADFNGVKFPIDPMIGVIGTAPDGEDVIDGFVGAHGGNLDNKLITKGTRMYFPVRVPGALLQMGDVHAAMGDARAVRHGHRDTCRNHGEGVSRQGLRVALARAGDVRRCRQVVRERERAGIRRGSDERFEGAAAPAHAHHRLGRRGNVHVYVRAERRGAQPGLQALRGAAEPAHRNSEAARVPAVGGLARET